MTVRHLTGCKQLVVLLNRMGHTSSYDELLAVDTSLAQEVLPKVETFETVTPSNISPGSFVQLAADNNDLNEETIDECNVDEDTMLSKVEDCRRAIKTKVEVESMVKEFLQEPKELRSMFQKFAPECRENSKMFTFWEEYGDMAKFCTLALLVYISDTKSLVTKHPEVHQEFVKGSHAVIALANLSPSHEHASVTTSLKGMFLQESTHLDGHKEAAAKRMARDEAYVRKLIHQDGSLKKTMKSALATLVEAKVNVCARLELFARDTIHLIDGMALIQVMNYCKELHIVFDQYWDALIKAGERENRGALSASLEIKFHGASTPVPKQWAKFIPNSQNKINLCEFLSETFCELGRQQLPPEKTKILDVQ
eukprot:gene4273-4841_t